MAGRGNPGLVFGAIGPGVGLHPGGAAHQMPHSPIHRPPERPINMAAHNSSIVVRTRSICVVCTDSTAPVTQHQAPTTSDDADPRAYSLPATTGSVVMSAQDSGALAPNNPVQVAVTAGAGASSQALVAAPDPSTHALTRSVTGV